MKIKPLEWKLRYAADCCWIAHTPLLTTYEINKYFDNFAHYNPYYLWSYIQKVDRLVDTKKKEFATLEEAQAAVQADFESKIKQCFEDDG